MNSNDYISKINRLYQDEREINYVRVENTTPYYLSLFIYVVIFFVVASYVTFGILIDAVHYHDFYSSTENTSEFLNYNEGVSIADISDYNALSNKDNFNYVRISNYVIYYTEGLLDYPNKQFISEQQLTEIFTNNNYLKVYPTTNEEFLDQYGFTVFDNFDITVGGSIVLKPIIVAIRDFSLYALAVIFLVMFNKRVLLNDFRSLRGKLIRTLKYSLFGLLFLVVGYFLVLGMNRLSFSIFNQKRLIYFDQIAYLKSLKTNYSVFILFTLILLAPITNEFIFRKAIFSLIINKKAALVLSSLLIAAVFANGFGINYYFSFVNYVVMSLLLGLLYLKNEENIIPNLLVSILINSLILLTTIYL